MKVIVKFRKKGYVKFLSHLDTMRLFQRIFRRTGIRLVHSNGFNPQPKMSFATALPLGTESNGEYMEVELEENIDLEELRRELEDNSPLGISIVKIKEKLGKDSIMSQIRWSEYIVKFDLENSIEFDLLSKHIENFLSKDEIIYSKSKKKKNKLTSTTTNIREYIKWIKVLEISGNELTLGMFLKTGSEGNLKPEIVVEKLEEFYEIGLDKDSIQVERIDLFLELEDRLSTPI